MTYLKLEVKNQMLHVKSYAGILKHSNRTFLMVMSTSGSTCIERAHGEKPHDPHRVEMI